MGNNRDIYCCSYRELVNFEREHLRLPFDVKVFVVSWFSYHPGFQRPLEKRRNETWGSARHPVASNQKLVSRFWIFCYWSDLDRWSQFLQHNVLAPLQIAVRSCHLRWYVLRQDYCQGLWNPEQFYLQVASKFAILFFCIISCTALLISIWICNILISPKIQHEVNFCSKHWTFILLLTFSLLKGAIQENLVIKVTY